MYLKLDPKKLAVANEMKAEFAGLATLEGDLLIFAQEDAMVLVEAARQAFAAYKKARKTSKAVAAQYILQGFEGAARLAGDVVGCSRPYWHHGPRM